MSNSYIVHGAPGSGSVPIEAALTLIGIHYDVVGEDVVRDIAYNPDVLTVNPLGQVPALVLPSGEVMTESAAILIYLADRYPDAQLAPSPGDKRRPAFLRWMTYVSAAFYGLAWVRIQHTDFESGCREAATESGGRRQSRALAVVCVSGNLAKLRVGGNYWRMTLDRCRPANGRISLVHPRGV